MTSSKIHPILLSSLTGLLLFAAWPVSPLTPLIFIAFVPLLWVERQGIRRSRFFGWTYLSMLLWNVGGTWWIWNATGPGAVAAIMANSLLMCVPWLGFHWIRRRMGNSFGYTSLILFWLSFEYFHLQNWGLSWPWLTLGNCFADHPSWIYWYRFTGTSGGSLWILVVNILLFQWLWQFVKDRQAGEERQFAKYRPFTLRPLWVALALVILPVAVGPLLSERQPDVKAGYEVVIVQPNVDPYQKIAEGSFAAQLQELIRLSESAIDSSTVLVVWPETALYRSDGPIEEDHLRELPFLHPLWAFLARHPRLNLLTGMETSRVFNYQHSATAYRIQGTDRFVEGYNAATILDSGGLVQSYHKSRLVPGVETLPSFLHFLDPWFEKFGGSIYGYTGQANRTPLPTTNATYKIAPAVCYESIYGEYLGSYSRNGADLIAIITNDGWWGNTPGHLQHENYARMRAVESGHWVVRSANTGISCVIDPNGRITESLAWDVPGVLKATVPPTAEMTFYTRYGDCISKLAVCLTILLLIWHFFTLTKRRTRSV